QAEDGIRGFHVTGVQTCALPIPQRRLCAPFRSGVTQHFRERGPPSSGAASGRLSAAAAVAQLRTLRWCARWVSGRPILFTGLGRSEERRVGNEGRWRRSRYLAVA